MRSRSCQYHDVAGCLLASMLIAIAGIVIIHLAETAGVKHREAWRRSPLSRLDFFLNDHSARRALQSKVARIGVGLDSAWQDDMSRHCFAAPEQQNHLQVCAGHFDLRSIDLSDGDGIPYQRRLAHHTTLLYG